MSHKRHVIDRSFFVAPSRLLLKSLIRSDFDVNGPACAIARASWQAACLCEQPERNHIKGDALARAVNRDDEKQTDSRHCFDVGDLAHADHPLGPNPGSPELKPHSVCTKGPQGRCRTHSLCFFNRPARTPGRRLKPELAFTCARRSWPTRMTAMTKFS